MAIAKRTVAYVGLLLGSATPITAVFAADLGKTLAEPVYLDRVSVKTISDIERCFIEADGITLPYIYRQPDRPDVSRIAYGAPGGGVPIVIDLARTAGRTSVIVHARGIVRGRIAAFLDSCTQP